MRMFYMSLFLTLFFGMQFCVALVEGNFLMLGWFVLTLVWAYLTTVDYKGIK